MRNHYQNDWDPRESSVLDDQRAAYDAERVRCPVAHSDFLDWSLFRHEDIVNVLNDPEIYASQSKRIQVPNGMDPPEHTAYREALEPFFTRDAMADLEARSRRIASGILESYAKGGDIAYMDDFAYPFTLKSLCLFVGWPVENWEFLRGWTHGNQEVALSRNRELGATLARGYESHVQAGLDERRQYNGLDYIEQDLAKRREAGVTNGDDIVSRLMRTEVNGALLTDEEIIRATRNWTAGHGTVAATLGIIVHTLAQDQSLQIRLRNDPSLIPAAVEEIPRVNGPLVANRRTTTQVVEIGGRTIPAGDKLSLMWIAANRDPQAFNQADEVLLDRDQSKNLLYGHGIHYCIGAELSRLELRIAIEELIRHTSGFTLVPDSSTSQQVYPSNGFQKLPIRVQPIAE